MDVQDNTLKQFKIQMKEIKRKYQASRFRYENEKKSLAELNENDDVTKKDLAKVEKKVKHYQKKTRKFKTLYINGKEEMMKRLGFKQTEKNVISTSRSMISDMFDTFKGVVENKKVTKTFQKKMFEPQQLVSKIQNQIFLEKAQQFNKKKVSVNAKTNNSFYVNEDPKCILNQLNELKITVEENFKTLDNNVNEHKEHVVNHKLNLNQFDKNRKSFEDLLKEFTLTQSNIQDSEFKLDDLMEKLLSKNDESDKIQIILHGEKEKMNTHYSELLEQQNKLKEEHIDLNKKNEMFKTITKDHDQNVKIHQKNVEIHKKYELERENFYEKLKNHNKKVETFECNLETHKKHVKTFESNSEEHILIVKMFEQEKEDFKKNSEDVKRILLRQHEHNAKINSENLKKFDKNVKTHDENVQNFELEKQNFYEKLQKHNEKVQKFESKSEQYEKHAKQLESDLKEHKKDVTNFVNARCNFKKHIENVLKDLLKEFSLTQKNIEDGELKLTQSMEKLLLQYKKSNEMAIFLSGEKDTLDAYYIQSLQHKLQLQEKQLDLMKKNEMSKM